MYLVVPSGGSFPETRRIELGPTPLTIGRAKSCEVRVDVPGVDDQHAKISEVALIALGPDCAIGDVPLDTGSRRLVIPGDEIQIGSVVLALEGDDPSLRAGDFADVTQKMPGAPPRMESPRVRVVEGSSFGDELLLKEEGREYVVGRGRSCDLSIDDREVSREHIKLMRKGYSVFIKDLSSTRGSWLGRSAVYSGSVIEWTRPRMLRVGATVLSLELPEIVRKAVPGAQVSAPMTAPPRWRGVGDAVHFGAPAASAAGRVSKAQVAMPPPRPGSPALAGGPPVLDAKALARPPVAVSGTPPPLPAGAPGSFTSVAPPPGPSRQAWKMKGPTIGKGSGILLLALAGLVILGGLFIVFSLLE